MMQKIKSFLGWLLWHLHSVLKYMSRSCLTNTSLRKRFGVEEHNRSIISRLISDAVDAGVIVLHDPDASPHVKAVVVSKGIALE